MMNSKTTELSIDGAGCASCVGKIEGALARVPGVQKAEMNFAQRTVRVVGATNLSSLIKAVENAGYNAKEISAENEEQFISEK